MSVAHTCPDCGCWVDDHGPDGCEAIIARQDDGKPNRCFCLVPEPLLWARLGLCPECGGEITSTDCRGLSCSHEACSAGCRDCGAVVW